MRLICTLSKDSPINPQAFVTFLKRKGIASSCEEGEEATYRIWVQDEERVEEAQEYFAAFQANPAYFAQNTASVREAPKVPPPTSAPPPPLTKKHLTMALLVAAGLLFFMGIFQGGMKNPMKISGVSEGPIFPPIYKTLIYDYPHYFELRDELLRDVPVKEGEHEHILSPEASALHTKILHTPFWTGIYDRVVEHVRKGTELTYHGPMWEKVGQGEVWRLFTPCLLHFDFIHIFFNALWILVLGVQIESKLGSLRYLLLILASALASNTAQYLMSGSFFLGLSGVVCGLAAFIWVRQCKAPWEGYLLHKLTFIFLAIFVLGMFALQLTFFFLQIFSTLELGISIANTAHLVGAAVGYLLGRLSTFALRPIRD